MANYDVKYNQLPENEETNAPASQLPGDQPMTLPSFPDQPAYDQENQLPPWGPPEGMPESPETPPWGPPSQLPDQPTTLPSFPDQPVYDPNDPNIPNWRPPIIIPVIPSLPSRPSTGTACNVRFLHAAVNQPGVSISINNERVESRLTYSNMTEYKLSSAGYVVFTIRSNVNNTVLNRTAFTLQDGNIYTIAIINAANGIALYLMQDTPCNKSIYHSCIRVANLTNNAPTLDILMSGNQLIYQNVRFLDVTEYRQLNAGLYTISAASSQHCHQFSTISNRAVQIIPVIIGVANNNCFRNILVTSQMSIAPNMVYTIYIIGNAYSAPNMQMILAESYFEY